MGGGKRKGRREEKKGKKIWSKREILFLPSHCEVDGGREGEGLRGREKKGSRVKVRSRRSPPRFLLYANELKIRAYGEKREAAKGGGGGERKMCCGFRQSSVFCGQRKGKKKKGGREKEEGKRSFGAHFPVPPP